MMSRRFTGVWRETEFLPSKKEENTYEEIHTSLLGIMLGVILE
jgi:hypothetical protein